MTEIHAFDPDGTPSPGAQAALDLAVAAIPESILDPQVASYVSAPTATREALDTRYGLSISPKAFGAVGDGVTDDTLAWQAAVDACPPGGTVDGVGATYLVSTINLHSDMTVQNARFLTLPGAVDMVSPITIGAYHDTELHHSITVRRVHVDGQRSQQTDIGDSEDGGRHGFRIIGRVRDILIEDSSASHCASDGLCIFHGLGMGDFLRPDTGIATNIRVLRSTFTWNRRHGASYDSLDGALFEDCKFNDNGLNINGGVTEGDRGDLLGGSLYGNGIDAEEYADNTWTGNVRHVRCEMLRNAKAGYLALQPSANDAGIPGWVARSGYHFIECRMGKGQAPSADSSAIELTPAYANRAKGTYFDDVQIVDCTIDGTVWVRSAGKVQHRGGTITGNASLQMGALENVVAASVDVPTRGALTYTAPSSTVRYAPLDAESIWLAPANFTALGSATSGMNGRNIASWSFVAGAVGRIGTTFNVPYDWKQFHVDLIWLQQEGTPDGDIAWRADNGPLTPGTPAAAPVSGESVPSATQGQHQIVTTRIGTGRTATPGPMALNVLRVGQYSTLDTSPLTGWVLGVRVIRAA